MRDQYNKKKADVQLIKLKYLIIKMFIYFIMDYNL